MTLELYLKPFDFFEDKYSESTFSIGSHIVPFSKHVNLSDFDIALLSVPDYRGTNDKESSSDLLTSVRRELMKLKNGKWNKRLIDLGEVVAGPSFYDTQERLKEITSFLIKCEVVPLIMIGSQSLISAVSEAHRFLKLPYSMTNISSDLALVENGGKCEDQTYLNSIFAQNPNYLKSYSHIGHQEYLVNSEIIDMLDRWNYEMLRLGILRENVELAEPVLRTANIVSFDTQSLSHQFFSASKNPFGLAGEEACKLSFYAGMGDEINCFCLSGIGGQGKCQEAKLLAIIAWYFLDGLNRVSHDKTDRLRNSQKFIVPFGEKSEDLVFYKERITGKWWLEVSLSTHGGQPIKDLIPCSRQDYLEATKGHPPKRWMSYLERSF